MFDIIYWINCFLHENIWNYWFQDLKKIFFELCIMYFDHIHPKFSQIPPFPSTQLYVSSSSKKKKKTKQNVKTNCAVQNILGCVVFLWNVVDLPGAISLEKTDSFSPNNWQLPVASHLGIGFYIPTHSPCWDLVLLGLSPILYLLWWFLRVHM